MTKEMKVGLVTISGILIFIFAIVIAKGFFMFSDNQTLYIVFDNVKGLQVGEPVAYNGVKIGKVSDIQLTERNVIVKTDIWQYDFLKTTMSASIDMKEITGGKQINLICLQSDNLSELKNGDTLIGINRPDLTDLISDFSNMKDDISNLLKKADISITSIHDFLGDTTFKNKIFHSVENAENILAEINAITQSGKPNKIINDIKKTVTDLNNLISENKGTVKEIIVTSKMTIDKLNEFATLSNDNKDDINAIIQNLKNITSNLNNKNSIAGKIINDKELSNKLDSILNDLNIFIKQVQEHGINTNIRLGTRP